MRLTYRPEIDGLRAIAVVSVIFYHAQITIFGHQPFKGGFIGVDIFFVISGYLITSIILKELVSTGSFSFKHFYERRIRRILPALLFVMSVSLPFAWLYLLPSSFVDFSKSILYSLGFSSNFYFHYSGQQYGAESGLFKPFLHTWTLSVEEQYYIISPIVLLIVFKYFRKYLIHILILGFIISLGLADWGSRNHPSFNFYILPTRMWELLAGSLLAYFEIIRGYRSKNKALNLILPFAGLILIGHFILFFNDKMFHPSFYTLSPIIGVCLIIWFSNKDEIITKILSTKLLVGIGLISYSLYLWHYPIFTFARVVEFTQGSLFNKLILGLIIIILSTFSYYLIEKTFRNQKNNFKFTLYFIFFFIFFLFWTNLMIIKNKGYYNRVPEILREADLRPWTSLIDSNNENCFDKKDACIFNNLSNKKIYIIGDSHAGALAYDLKDRLVQKDYQFITLYQGFFVFPDFILRERKNNIIVPFNMSKNVQEFNNKLKKEKDAIIIFAGRFPLYLNNNLFDNKEGGIEGSEWPYIYTSNKINNNIKHSFKELVNELSIKNKIILIYPIPEIGYNVSKKLFIERNNKFKKNIHSIVINTDYFIYKDRSRSSFELLNSLKSNNIYRLYPHKLFCNTILKNRCVANDQLDIYYLDFHHVSLKGARMINDLIIKQIEKINPESN